MADPRACREALTALLGPEGCKVDGASLRVYGRDASDLELGRPLAVVLPVDDREVAAIIRICADHGVAMVARGAGTGLSGGAVPAEGSVVISLARWTGSDDPALGRVHVEPGVTNAALNRRLAAHGLCFAPDPGSQEAATIGGNIAENAGGPHCLQVGMTIQHVRGLQWRDGRGGAWRSDTASAGFDLTPLLVGSEGTLGLVTAAELDATPLPDSTATLLVYFPEFAGAAAAVSDLLGAGLLPAAMEVIDGVMLDVVEEAFAFGFRTSAAAAMIIEFSGSDDAVRKDAETAAARLEAVGCDVQRARDSEERLALWRCRKRAFGAVGRVSPNYLSLDVAVPIGRLPAAVAAVGEAADRHGVRIATALHAGDGNVHPGIMYDAADGEQSRRAHAAAEAILDAALALSGTVTGEHGVGLEKLEAFARQCDPNALALMQGVKAVFDPTGLWNPGKALPERATGAHRFAAPEDVVFDWASLTVTAPGDADLEQLQRRAAERGFRIPAPAWPVGTSVAHAFFHDDPDGLGGRRLRDSVLEVWATTGDHRRFHAGRPVVKNVAGYDLPRLLCGSRGCLADLDGVSFLLRPATPAPGAPADPSPPELVDPGNDPHVPVALMRALKDLFDPERRLFTPSWLERQA